MDDLWVFDAASGRASRVRQEGDWHPASSLVPLVVQDGVLYLLGGRGTSSAHGIPLATLSVLLEEADVQRALEAILRLDKDVQSKKRREFTGSGSVWRDASWGPQERAVEEFVGAEAWGSESNIRGAGDDLESPRSLRAALDGSQLELTEAHERLEEVSCELAVTLTELQQVKKSEEEATALRRELEAERERCQKLEAQLCAQRVQDSFVRVPLPFVLLPPLLFPLQGVLDGERSRKFQHSLESHSASLPRDSGFLREYERMFGPLLADGLGPRILAASVLSLAQTARERSVLQVAAVLRPGQFFPASCGLPALTRLHPLRTSAKLQDSATACCWRSLCTGTRRTPRNVREQAPPTFQALSALLDRPEGADPLRSEAFHAASGRLREAVQARGLLRSAGRIMDLQDAIGFLGALERAGRKRGEREAAPWG